MGVLGVLIVDIVNVTNMIITSFLLATLSVFKILSAFCLTPEIEQSLCQSYNFDSKSYRLALMFLVFDGIMGLACSLFLFTAIL